MAMRETMGKGVRDALLAAVLFGLSAPVAKSLVGDLPPQLVAGLLYLGAGVGLSALGLFRKTNTPSEGALSRSDVPVLTGAIAFGGIVAPFLLMLGLQWTSAAGSALLLNLESVFTAAIAWMIVRENVSVRIATGWLAILGGAVILSWSSSAQVTQRGLLAIAGACLCWGIDNNLTQKISGTDPVQIAKLKGLVAGAVNTLLAGALAHRFFAPVSILAALLLGFVSYGLSLVLYIRALRALGTARAGNYFSVAPFVGAIAGVILWRESFTTTILMSGTLMGFGLWLHVTERHEHRHAHEPLFHEHPHIHDEHHQHVHSPEDPTGEPHNHPHRHERLEHSHPHYPDIHHRHPH